MIFLFFYLFFFFYFIFYILLLFSYFLFDFGVIWAATWQNQQNGMCAQRRLKISLGIRPVWSESSLSAWRKLGSLATHWAHSKDFDQTLRMPRLIWVFAGRTVILLLFLLPIFMSEKFSLHYSIQWEYFNFRLLIAVLVNISKSPPAWPPLSAFMIHLYIFTVTGLTTKTTSLSHCDVTTTAR